MFSYTYLTIDYIDIPLEWIPLSSACHQHRVAVHKVVLARVNKICYSCHAHALSLGV